ncbi:hypothetical protein BaRGS_00030299 [Batillaria attramentaria]|uniref:Uncharacterized protein n=1 Tax=Batillaria attramentaria TaxID=370345 RepID=A0ABD0JV96_9CAEN
MAKMAKEKQRVFCRKRSRGYSAEREAEGILQKEKQRVFCRKRSRGYSAEREAEGILQKEKGTRGTAVS